MGNVVWLDHSAASAGADDRAASSAKSSAVSPASLAFPVRSNAAQKSAGMLSRCGHLRTADTVAPTSDAKASGESHKATTSRKLQTMEGNLGQLVLESKSELSQDPKKVLGHNVPMDKYAKRAAALALIARTREARSWTTLGQIKMAKALGIDQGKYKQYETRTPMPMIYHEKFCDICGCSLPWLRDGVGPSRRAPARRERIA